MVFVIPSSSSSDYASLQFTGYSCPIISFNTNKCDALAELPANEAFRQR